MPSIRKQSYIEFKAISKQIHFDNKNITDEGRSPGIFLLYFTPCKPLCVKQTKRLSYVMTHGVHSCVHMQRVTTRPFIHEEELPICCLMNELVLTHEQKLVIVYYN